MALQKLIYVFWIMGPVLQAGIAMLMLKRKIYQDFPIFFAYTVLHVLRSIGGHIFVHMPGNVYFYWYWWSEAALSMVDFMVVREVYRFTFRDYPALNSLITVIFRWAFAVLVVFCLVTGVTAPGADINRTTAGLFVMQRSVYIIVSGLLLLLVIFCRTFGLRWQSYAMGVALGLGIASAATVIADALRSQMSGPQNHDAFVILSSIGYIVGLAIWCVYFYRPVTENSEAVASLDHSTVHRWNEALEALTTR